MFPWSMSSLAQPGLRRIVTYTDRWGAQYWFQSYLHLFAIVTAMLPYAFRCLKTSLIQVLYDSSVVLTILSAPAWSLISVLMMSDVLMSVIPSLRSWMSYAVRGSALIFFRTVSMHWLIYSLYFTFLFSNPSNCSADAKTISASSTPFCSAGLRTDWSYQFWLSMISSISTSFGFRVFCISSSMRLNSSM